MTQNILKIEDLSFSYANQEVLKDVNLELSKGERVSILGESGSGKSSLLRCIAGFEPVSNGKIFIKNKLVSSNNLMIPTEKRNVGMVAQEKALFPHLTVKKNISFGIERKKNKDEVVTELTNLFKITNLIDKLQRQISGGEQQRVAFARSLAPSPNLLMLDEPFNALDQELKGALYSELNQIFEERKQTILLVSHDLKEAEVLSQRQIII